MCRGGHKGWLRIVTKSGSAVTPKSVAFCAVVCRALERAYLVVLLCSQQRSTRAGERGLLLVVSKQMRESEIERENYTYLWNNCFTRNASALV